MTDQPKPTCAENAHVQTTRCGMPWCPIPSDAPVDKLCPPCEMASASFHIKAPTTVSETKAPRPPNGRPAHERLFEAIIGLSDQFAVCGLEQPVAILVKPGQAELIQAMVMHSPNMLFDDARRGELRIWGIPILEAAP